jgi:hypothetical protein
MSIGAPVTINPMALETQGFENSFGAIDPVSLLTGGFVWMVTSIWTDVDFQGTTIWTDVDLPPIHFTD